jgi:hypothetical protein
MTRYISAVQNSGELALHHFHPALFFFVRQRVPTTEGGDPDAEQSLVSRMVFF